MVGAACSRRSYSLEQVLSKNDIQKILQKTIGDVTECELICSEVNSASEGLCGFLGDHIRAALHVRLDGRVQAVRLFVKTVPRHNKPKAEFIDEHNYFKREMLMYQLIEEINGNAGPNPWCARAYVYTEDMIVMPDLAAAGYKVHPVMETLDLQHVLLTTASLARYHAAFANYETRKSLVAKRPHNFFKDHEHLLEEATFFDSPFVRSAAKLTADFIAAFSTQYSSKTIPDLEAKLAKLFIKASESLDVIEDSLNVLIHKDLWNNNILFKYEGETPSNAILIDYQCMRYGPPAFDLTVLLYLTTSRKFRERHEKEVFEFYFNLFSECLEDSTKKRLQLLGYAKEEFLLWCEKSRLFGLFEAVAIYPFVLMDPRRAEQVFDDPDTYITVIQHDRSQPVIDYAKECPIYRDRCLEVSEEFLERYVLDRSSIRV